MKTGQSTKKKKIRKKQMLKKKQKLLKEKEEFVRQINKVISHQQN